MSDEAQATLAAADEKVRQAEAALAWQRVGAARGLVSYGALALYEDDVRQAEQERARIVAAREAG